MNNINIKITLPNIPPEISKKLAGLYEAGVLGYYISNLIISSEYNNMLSEIKDTGNEGLTGTPNVTKGVNINNKKKPSKPKVSPGNAVNINRAPIESTVVTPIEQPQINKPVEINKKPVEEPVQEPVEYDQDAEDFLNNLMSI